MILTLCFCVAISFQCSSSTMPRTQTCARFVDGSAPIPSRASDQTKYSAPTSLRLSRSRIPSAPRPNASARVSMLALLRSLASWAQSLSKKPHKQRRLPILRRRLRQRLPNRLTLIISNRYMQRAPHDAYTENYTKLLTHQTCYCMFWIHETRLVRSVKVHWNTYERKRRTSKLY